jgi:hypothetical protein
VSSFISYKPIIPKVYILMSGVDKCAPAHLVSVSLFAHREYTHYQGEVMVASTMFASSGEPPRFSRLTAALFEDSGELAYASVADNTLQMPMLLV